MCTGLQGQGETTSTATGCISGAQEARNHRLKGWKALFAVANFSSRKGFLVHFPTANLCPVGNRAWALWAPDGWYVVAPSSGDGTLVCAPWNTQRNCAVFTECDHAKDMCAVHVCFVGADGAQLLPYSNLPFTLASLPLASMGLGIFFLPSFRLYVFMSFFLSF